MSAIMFKPATPTVEKNCTKCFNSMFRQLRGVTVLYCGYYYRPVATDGCCNAWTGDTETKGVR